MRLETVLVINDEPCPGLIVLDLGLPDGEGIDVCREIRNAGPIITAVGA